MRLPPVLICFVACFFVIGTFLWLMYRPEFRTSFVDLCGRLSLSLALEGKRVLGFEGDLGASC